MTRSRSRTSAWCDRTRAHTNAHPVHAVLIVEIAESSYRTDREYEAGLYARAGVLDYWIVDVVRDVLEVHREPETSAEAAYGWRYRSVTTPRPPEIVTPLVAPRSSIRVADLLS